MIKGIWPLCSSFFNPVEQEAMAGQFNSPSHPVVLKKCKHEWEYTSEIVYSKEFLEVAIIVANIHWRKTFISS